MILVHILRCYRKTECVTDGKTDGLTDAAESNWPLYRYAGEAIDILDLLHAACNPNDITSIKLNKGLLHDGHTHPLVNGRSIFVRNSFNSANAVASATNDQILEWFQIIIGI